MTPKHSCALKYCLETLDRIDERLMTLEKEESVLQVAEQLTVMMAFVMNIE